MKKSFTPQCVRNLFAAILFVAGIFGTPQLSAQKTNLTQLDLPCDTISVDAIFYGNNPTSAGGADGSITLVAIICNGKNASAPEFLGGGNKWVLPCTFVWTPDGETASTIQNKKAGTYIVKTTTAQGCEVFDTIVLKDPSATGINNIKSGLEFMVSPNPVKAQMLVSVSALANENCSFSLYNSIGQVVLKKAFQVSPIESKIELDVINLEAGVYYLGINSLKENRLEKVLITK